MVRLQRGFKSQAKRIASEIRSELRVRPTSPLDPWLLAAYLEVPILPLSQFKKDAPFAYKHFTWVDQDAFSAVTVFHGSRRIIVHNDSHHPGRQASNLGHEISHAILLHPPTPALDDSGCRDWDPEIEAEAEWLAGLLLVPDQAAIKVVREGKSLYEAADYYGVTRKLLKFRINLSGARKRAQWIEARYGKR